MRRRRPSALYTVLDEEQLLGDVDLADHQDPLAGRSRDEGWEEWDEWSPDAEEDAESSIPRRREEGARRRRARLVFVGALVLVLLVAREVGVALEAAGSRARRPTIAGASAGGRPGAPTSLPPPSTPTASGLGVRRDRPGVSGPRVSAGPSVSGAPSMPGGRPSVGGRASADPAHQSRAQTRRPPVGAGGLPAGQAQGPASAGGRTSPPVSRPAQTPARARPVGRGRQAAGHQSPAVAPGSSPAQEFGFER